MTEQKEGTWGAIWFVPLFCMMLSVVITVTCNKTSIEYLTVIYVD